MNDETSESKIGRRPGERVVKLPAQTDAGVYFIGTIRTPWRSRRECPRRGDSDGPVCSIMVDARWQPALTGLAGHPRLQILYWMHEARRDLVLQVPFHTGHVAGTFSLRSPARPNPIASSTVALVAVHKGVIEVRGLDCIDGTPLIDIKPDRFAARR